ncbi:hypothetical protein [Streptomyces sp. SYP-A7185]|uniref:hypothetical protein n=1 Tax=Streptomyces sp. SYP-A7185 TaxID=3040076 RepID=UPI0038F7EB7D
MTTGTLPDLARLSGDQLRGWACALCGTRLYADRLLGTVAQGQGEHTEFIDLWACAPSCPCRPCGPGERARY